MNSNFRQLSVKGELSNVKYHGSGHIYFTLKDNRSVIKGIVFSNNAKNIRSSLEDGQKVVVTGSVGVYTEGGTYQIYATDIIPEGRGELYEKYEKLRKELEEMGMFDESYKKPIPRYVRTLGVVTAPTGAAVMDIINVSKRRFPYIQIVLYPALVQGEGAAESIVKGIEALDSYGVDCIIAGRGGGSIEDLWAFNEEIVARAIFACNTPIISAVGHQTDTTIADFVADRFAPTPSAAAELAVFDYREFSQHIHDRESKLRRLMDHRIRLLQTRLEKVKAQLIAHSPQNMIREQKMHLISLGENLENLMKQILADRRRRLEQYETALPREMKLKLTDRRHRLELYAGRLEGSSPLLKMSQGFSVVEDSKGHTLSDIGKVAPGDSITVHVKNGEIYADVTGTAARTDVV